MRDELFETFLDFTCINRRSAFEESRQRVGFVCRAGFEFGVRTLSNS